MTVSVEVATDALWSELQRMAVFRDCLTDEEFLGWLADIPPADLVEE